MSCALLGWALAPYTHIETRADWLSDSPYTRIRGRVLIGWANPQYTDIRNATESHIPDTAMFPYQIHFWDFFMREINYIKLKYGPFYENGWLIANLVKLCVGVQLPVLLPRRPACLPPQTPACCELDWAPARLLQPTAPHTRAKSPFGLVDYYQTPLPWQSSRACISSLPAS